MKKFERICFIIMVFCLLWKLLGLWGLSIIFVITSISLSVFYFLFTLHLISEIKFQNLFKKSSYINLNALKAIGLVIFGYGLSSIVIGILFIVQHWIDGILYLLQGIIVLSIVGIISFVKIKNNPDKKFYKEILLRVAVWLILAGITYFIF